MKLIGKGSFTKCYLLPCGSRVQLISRDPVKEAMAWGWFPESDLFPKLDYVDLGVYEMEYLEPARSIKQALMPEHWSLYKELRDLFLNKNPANNCSRPDDLYHLWYGVFEEQAEKYALGSFMFEAYQDIMMALDACANFGSDVVFEISPRNIRIKDGKLILLDCFFIHSALTEGKK